MADKEVLKNELVEADGSGFSVLKKSGDVKHLKRTKPAKSEKGKAATKRFWNQKNEESRHGRFAVLRGRFTKKSILKPLPSRSVAKGSPGAGETVKEFSRVVKKHVDGSSVLACTDSGSAVVGAFSAIGVPTAAARHSLETWTLSFWTALSSPLNYVLECNRSLLGDTLCNPYLQKHIWGNRSMMFFSHFQTS